MFNELQYKCCWRGLRKGSEDGNTNAPKKVEPMQRAFFWSRIVVMRVVDVLRVLNIQNTAFLCSNDMANLERQARWPRLRLREIDPKGACIIVSMRRSLLGG